MTGDQDLIPGVDYEVSCCPSCGTTGQCRCWDAPDPFPPRPWPHHDEDDEL